jgi:hypothetical protein
MLILRSEHDLMAIAHWKIICEMRISRRESALDAIRKRYGVTRDQSPRELRQHKLDLRGLLDSVADLQPIAVRAQLAKLLPSTAVTRA